MAGAAATPDQGIWRRYCAVAVIGLVLLLNHTDRLILGILIEPIRQEFRLTDGQLGLLTGPAFALVYGFCVFPIARLAERKSRVAIVTTCLLIWSAATAGAGLATGFGILMLSRMILGSAEAGGISPSMSVVSDLFPAHQRAGAMSVFGLGATAGVLLAPLIGGALMPLVGWRGTFLIVGLAGIPLALLLLLFVREPQRGRVDGLVTTSAIIPFTSSLRRLVRRRSYALLLIGFVLVSFAQFALFLWLPSFFQRSYGIEPAALGPKLALYQGLPLLAGNIIGGFVADRLARHDQRWLAWLMMLSSTITVPAAAMLFAVHDENIALAMLAAPSLAQGLSAGAGYALLQNLSAVHSRATSTALVAFCATIVGVGLGPLTLGLLSQFLSARFGPESLRCAFFLICPIFAAAALCFGSITRFLKDDLEDARRDSLSASATAI
ncbi:MAG: MFS transporter [Alphaproteobacteria bacterium]|nr:MFS transporter [Alphaproteobacteria bacterium]